MNIIRDLPGLKTGCRVALLLVSPSVMIDVRDVYNWLRIGASSLSGAGGWVSFVRFEVCRWMFQFFCSYQVETAIFVNVVFFRLVIIYLSFLPYITSVTCTTLYYVCRHAHSECICNNIWIERHKKRYKSNIL